MMQNTSHAVMAQRYEAANSLDDFPTPKWATRALMEEGLKVGPEFRELTCWEPACGRGYMASALAEYFGRVWATDIYPYGFGDTRDFLGNGLFETAEQSTSIDWVITNPPFKLAEQFIVRALEVAQAGVAMLVRTVFLESLGRYERLFKPCPPTFFAQFVERVPMVKGRVDPKASTATGYCWIVWEKPSARCPELRWIPPCRKRLERPGDYQVPGTSKNELPVCSETAPL